jgi:nitrate reductase molybdenum cofactor assembly chaperone NarJ/NarW
MIRTLKAMSVLLDYPTAELQAATGDIAAVLATEGHVPRPALQALRPLLDGIATADLYDLEERYVALFDRSRTLSLDLFEHVHGESRDRGGAMVDLLETYRADGYEPRGDVLPDHLPVLLEYLSIRPEAEARAMLAECAHILEALHQRLQRRETPYAAIFAALVAFAGARPNAAAVEALGVPEEDPDDLAALDAVWEEAAVTFGPDPNAGCPATREMLARIDIPRNPAIAAE